MKRWNKDYLLSFIDSHIINYSVPINLDYMRRFGSAVVLFLIIQTGFFQDLSFCDVIDQTPVDSVDTDERERGGVRSNKAIGAYLFASTAIGFMMFGVPGVAGVIVYQELVDAIYFTESYSQPSLVGERVEGAIVKCSGATLPTGTPPEVLTANYSGAILFTISVVGILLLLWVFRGSPPGGGGGFPPDGGGGGGGGFPTGGGGGFPLPGVGAGELLPRHCGGSGHEELFPATEKWTTIRTPWMVPIEYIWVQSPFNTIIIGGYWPHLRIKPQGYFIGDYDPSNVIITDKAAEMAHNVKFAKLLSRAINTGISPEVVEAASTVSTIIS